MGGVLLDLVFFYVNAKGTLEVCSVNGAEV